MVLEVTIPETDTKLLLLILLGLVASWNWFLFTLFTKKIPGFISGNLLTLILSLPKKSSEIISKEL